MCSSFRGGNKKKLHRWWGERPGMADCRKCQQTTPPVNNAAMNIEHRKGANWLKGGQIYVSGGKLDSAVVEHTIEYVDIKL